MTITQNRVKNEEEKKLLRIYSVFSTPTSVQRSKTKNINVQCHKNDQLINAFKVNP